MSLRRCFVKFEGVLLLTILSIYGTISPHHKTKTKNKRVTF